MFKNLKKKLEQGVAQSKAVVSGFTRGDDSSENNTSSDSLGKPAAESTPQKDVNQIRPVVEDFSSPVSTGVQKSGLSVHAGQLDDMSLSESSSSAHPETASDGSSFLRDETSKDNRSRTSSISSMASESTFFPSVNLSHSYQMPSDAESEMEETSLNLSSISKEDLHTFVKRFEQRAFKYKAQFMEIAAAYKELLQEKEKLKSTLAQHQDGASRRVSELKEQIHLDQLAKRDLEENYRLLLEEKDEHTKTLQMQIRLLKEGRDNPEELEAKLVSKQVKAEAAPSIIDVVSKDSNSASQEIQELKSKIKRQDGLLQKCKDTITNYKEKISQLSQEKQELLGKLELVSKGGDRANIQTPDQISRLQAQIQEARKVIEELESDRDVAIAEVKHQVHEEMEKKDAELELVKGQQQKFLAENNSLKLEIEKLTNETEELRRTSQEQLEKARNIMRKLKEDKQLALEQTEARIKQAEQSMEEEKEKMLSDLKRGKAEAFSVMQHESEKNLAEKVEAAIEERDKFWNKKLADLVETHKEMLRSKDREKEMALATMQEEVRQKLKEKEKEVRLALEERELQKMAAVTGLDEQKDRLLLQIEEISSEKIELSNRFSKFQEDSEHQMLELKQRLNNMETEHSRVINELQTSHEEALTREKSKLVQKAAEDIELIKQRHAEEVQNLIDKQEQDLQESSSEMESYYRSQLEHEKENLENLLMVTKEQLEEIKNSFSLNQAKLTEKEKLLAKVQAELESRKKEQGAYVERKSSLTVEHHVSEEADLTQKDQVLTEVEHSTDVQITVEGGSSSDLRLLSEELKSVRRELAAAKNELNALKTGTCTVEEETQQSVSQSENEREKSNSQTVQELKKQILELNEEHECLNRNVENSRIRIEELEKCLEETVNVKKAAESKTQDFEIQVGQLQEVIRTLESCQNTVEKEKASLEQKLTFLENIVEDLKASKEELNEKLHGRHEAFIQRSTEEKQVLELRASEFASQVNVMKEEVDALNRALLSKNDENIALRSVVDDNTRFIKSLETKIEKLTAELHIKSQTSSQNEAALTKSLEKFEKLKNEANAKVKGLKEMKDSLTEQLNEKQKEIEEIRSTFTLEKDTVIKNYEEKLSKQEEEMRALEQSFKEQFNQKQAKFKEIIVKLKEQHENVLKEKDKQFEDYKTELASTSDVGIGDMTKDLENLRERLKYQEQKHQAVIDDKTAEWETTFQKLNESHSQELDSICSQYQQQISDLQEKLLDKDGLTQELNSLRDKFASAQKELEDTKLQMERISEKQSVEADALNAQLQEKDAQIQSLTASLESLHKQSLDESRQKESLTSQIHSLTEQLYEKDTKLESMAGTISAEQEYLHKQLGQQSQIAEELQAQKCALSEQLKEAVEKHDAHLQEKDALLNDASHKNALLEIEHASLREMLRTVVDTSQERDISPSSLQELLQHFQGEKDAKIHDLESHLETVNNRVTVLQEELTSLRDHHEQALFELKQNHSKEIDIIKSDYDSQISCLSSVKTELQTEAETLKSQLSEANEKLQKCIQSYESKLEDERSKLERQEGSFKEQLNVLNQQFHEVQSKAVVSSSELQSSLHENAKEREAAQLQLHQKEIEIVKQEAESKMKDLKQKYIARLKEVQSQAKDTIEELENTLQNEKAAKSEMCVELTRANTRLLQLEENSGTSRDTIVDLEHRVVEMTALLKSKDSELAILKANMASNENNMQEILEEAEANCRQINGKLIEAEAMLKQNESDILSINDQLQAKHSLLEQREIIIRNLESKCLEAEKTCIQEKEKYEHELKEKNEECLHLKVLLETTQNELEMEQNRVAELNYKVQTTSSSVAEMEGIQTEKQHLQNEILQLSAEKEELKVKLLETEAAFEMSSKEHASLVADMENRVSDSESQKEQIKQDYETRLSQLQQVNAELSVSVETQISSKVAEYKKKAETYISQMKKQLQDEHTVLFDKQQENVSKLEETVAILTEEISDLKQSKESLIAESENIMQNMKSQKEQEMMLKQSVIEECEQKEKEFNQSESSLKKEIDSLLSEKNSLLEKLSVIEKEQDKWKVQLVTEIEELKSKNEELLKNLGSLESDREELAALKVELEVLQKQKSNQANLEVQTNEHTSKMEQLIKETNLQIAEKDREIENVFKENIDKNEQDRQGLMQEHHKVLNELRHEIIERDKHIEELQAKIQEAFQQNQTTFSVFQRGAAEDAMHQEQVTLHTADIEQIKEQHKQEVTEIQSRLEMGHNSLPQPLVAVPTRLNMDVLDPNFSVEMQNLELHNMDLQAQVSQLYGELSLYKIKEREFLRKMDKLEHLGKSMSDDDDPPLSLDGSFMNHTDSAIFREPTEFEYLKNILYEYMMGRETKTLAKVIATVVRFSDEQMRNVLTKEDAKLRWKKTWKS